MRPVSSRTSSTMRLCVQYPLCRNSSADIVPLIPLGPVLKRFGVAPSIGGGLPHPATPSAMRPTTQMDARKRMRNPPEVAERENVATPLYLARSKDLRMVQHA